MSAATVASVTAAHLGRVFYGTIGAQALTVMSFLFSIERVVQSNTGGLMLKRKVISKRAWIGTISALLITLGGLFVPQSAATAAPGDKLIGYGSQLTINGTPYAFDPKTKSFAPAAATTLLVPFPPSGYHTLTRAEPFWSFGDSNGTGYQQVSYATNTEQWGYNISAAVQAIVVGNVTQNADLYHGSTRSPFGSHVVSAGYFFHGSSGGIVRGLPTYAVTQVITFRCNVGANCTGRIDARWTWLMQ